MNAPQISRRLAVLLSMALSACVSAPRNAPLKHSDPETGYRIANVVNEDAQKKTYVILSFSGGGTRAAAFAFGVLEALRATDIGGGRTLLDEVDVMSSVSGGSFTAAYYALHGEHAFETFPTRFLYQDVQGALFWKLFNPINWYRLASSTFDRIDMAAEYYDEEVFDGATFADLSTHQDRPFVAINATDMTLGSVFEFTQDQFDLLNSDLAKFPIARAVAASSAFPVLLSPIRVVNYPATDGLAPPPWIENGIESRAVNVAAWRRAADARSYLETDSAGKARPFIHLVDGGISDNIGLRGTLVASTTTRGGAWSLLRDINRGVVERVVVIAADAKTEPKEDWDRNEESPGFTDVLLAATTNPMDNYSTETIEALRTQFKHAKQLNDAFEACEKLVREHDPEFRLPPMPRAELHFIHLSFDDIADACRRTKFKELPTSFALEAAQVDALRKEAGALLRTSEAFAKLLAALRGE